MTRRDEVVFRFCDAEGNITPESNPNGSAENITGILNRDRNVLLMMPHPERSSEGIMGSEDGRRVFKSMIAHIEQCG
jgi:phosphoribosylformylglycinamidine synthase